MTENMPSKRKEVGAIGEKLAADFLKKHSYKIIQRNFRCRGGEIDIIAQHNDCMVFVEVRTKRVLVSVRLRSLSPSSRGRSWFHLPIPIYRVAKTFLPIGA